MTNTRRKWDLQSYLS